MELKVIVGQLCVAAIAITCILMEHNSGLTYLAMGGLLASIGYPFVASKPEEEAVNGE